VSSTYRILCLNHDPALVLRDAEYNSADDAVAAISEGVDGHPGCDLIAGAYCHPLITVYCPATRERPANRACFHRLTTQTDTVWLRLLAAAHQSTDPAVQTLAAARPLPDPCWPWNRLQRLRNELARW
jgi:hypothetical protein